MESRPLQYALVAYVRNSLGRFVESMRRDLHPDHTHSPAHITILPPRPIRGSEEEALTMVREAASKVDAFEVLLGEVETFYPTTPTVFLRVERHAHRIRDLHDALNTGPMRYDEAWPFMPHLTIVKMPELRQTQEALQQSRERWGSFSGPRIAHIAELTFVREGENGQWIDVADVPLRRPK